MGFANDYMIRIKRNVPQIKQINSHMFISGDFFLIFGLCLKGGPIQNDP